MLSPVDIETRPFMMLIDSGAGSTALSPQTAESLNESEDRSKTVRVVGIGGHMDTQHPLVLHSLRFGSLELTDFDVLTAHIERPEVESDAAAAAGMVGLDLLSKFDVEFDFPDHRMSLYHVASCSGRFIPWSGSYDSFMATRSPRGALLIPVVINGVTLRALIDTGSNVSSIGMTAAMKTGVDATAMSGDPAMTFVGARGSMMTAHRHRFDTMSVGAATFHNVRISVQDQDFPGMDMLLGMDFLRWRKVWLSFGTNQLFIQYTPRPPSRNPAVHALPSLDAPGTLPAQGGTSTMKRQPVVLSVMASVLCSVPPAFAFDRLRAEGSVPPVALDVRTSWQALNTAMQNVGYTGTALDNAWLSFDAAQHRCDHGVGDILELLDTQTALATAQQRRVQALADWHTAKLQLASKLGRLEIDDVSDH